MKSNSITSIFESLFSNILSKTRIDMMALANIRTNARISNLGT